MSKKLLFLLDGMALAYRAHFAFINANLRNSEGVATGPILGFANTLEKMLAEAQPTHVAVVWDTHAPTFRHIVDKNYKAQRPPQPEELKVGIPIIKRMLTAWGISNIEQDGYEADDIIGTIATQANIKDVDVMLVTPDKDFMQLVHDHIKIMKPNNKTGGFDLVDREGVKQYFGVYPEQVIDVLAILGDTVDNIPGVPGIGKKGAPKLIEKFGSLEETITKAETISAKRQREALIRFKEQALQAKFMVTIKTDVPNTIKWEKLEWKFDAHKELGLFFKEMEFRTLTKKYLGEQAPVAEQSGDQVDLFGTISEPTSLNKLDSENCDYELVSTIERVQQLVAEYVKADVLCFDTETDAPNPIQAGVVGFSFSVEAGKAAYIPVSVPGGFDVKMVCEILKPLFENELSTKVAHNFKFDYTILKRNGIEIKGEHFDTMIAAYLVDANQKIKMDELAKKYLHYEPVPITDLIGTGKSQKSMVDLSPQEVYKYACEDADITLQLYDILRNQMENDDLEQVANVCDFPLIEVLGTMELQGVRLDAEMLHQLSKELQDDLIELQTRIFEKAEEEFNINSPAQLGVILFEKLGLPAGKKTKTGKWSTNEAELTRLAVKYELPRLILDFRQLSKLKSTYVDALPSMVNSQTGRIHTDFNQSVAATGRLVSSNPNLQNIPIRTERGRETRKAFIAEDGYKIMSADYSQVELRVIAHIAKDEAMIAAFKNGEDIHARTAKEIFNLKSLAEVTADHRRKAKEVNFGIPYGLSAYGLAQNLGIENKEGKTMIEEYFNRFPNIKTYISDTQTFAKEHGYVKTLLGRRRYIPDITSSNWSRRGFAERVAINMPIQGTAADVIKLAMIHIDDWLTSTNKKSRMLLQVHDELIFEIHESELDGVPQKIVELMENAFPMDVPLKVESGIGENWLEAH